MIIVYFVFTVFIFPLISLVTANRMLMLLKCLLVRYHANGGRPSVDSCLLNSVRFTQSTYSQIGPLAKVEVSNILVILSVYIGM